LPQASAWQASQFAPGLNESEQMFGQNAAEIAKMALGQQQAKLDTQFNQGVGMGSGYLNQSRDLAQQTQANLMQALAGIYTNRQNLASQSANQINQFALQGGQAGESSAQNLMGQTMSAYNNPFNLGAGYMQGTPIFSPAMVQSGGK
jgi:hypothetical protein